MMMGGYSRTIVWEWGTSERWDDGKRKMRDRTKGDRGV
jgi:hypothetical protein